MNPISTNSTYNFSSISSASQGLQDYDDAELAHDCNLVLAASYLCKPNAYPADDDYFFGENGDFFHIPSKLWDILKEGDQGSLLQLARKYRTDIQQLAKKIREYIGHKKYTTIIFTGSVSQSSLEFLNKKFNITQIIVNESCSHPIDIDLPYLFDSFSNLKVLNFKWFEKSITLPSLVNLSRLKALYYKQHLITNPDKIEELKKTKSLLNCKLSILEYNQFTHLDWEFCFDSLLNRLYDFNSESFIDNIFRFLLNKDTRNLENASRFFKLQNFENIQNPGRIKTLNFSNVKVRTLHFDLKKFENLRELNLRGMPLEAFPEGVIDCKNLRALDLRTATTIIIPDKIKELIHLKFLALNGSSEEEIPESVKTIIKEKTSNLFELITDIDNNSIKVSWEFSFNNFFKETFASMIYDEIKKYLSFVDRCKFSQTSTFFNKTIIEKDKLEFANNLTFISFAVNFPIIKDLVRDFLGDHEVIYKEKTTNWAQKTELSILNTEKHAKAIRVKLSKDNFPFFEESQVIFSKTLVDLVFLSQKKNAITFFMNQPRTWFSIHSNPVRKIPGQVTKYLLKMNQLEKIDLGNLGNLEEVPELLLKIPNIKLSLPKKLQSAHASWLANREISVIDPASPSILSRMWALAKAVMLFVAKVLLVIALFAALAAMIAGGLYLVGYPLSLETLSSKVGFG